MEARLITKRGRSGGEGGEYKVKETSKHHFVGRTSMEVGETLLVGGSRSEEARADAVLEAGKRKRSRGDGWRSVE